MKTPCRLGNIKASQLCSLNTSHHRIYTNHAHRNVVDQIFGHWLNVMKELKNRNTDSMFLSPVTDEEIEFTIQYYF